MRLKPRGVRHLLFTTLAIACPLHCQTGTQKSAPKGGGAACVVAKKLGNSLAIEWATGETSITGAIEKAKLALREKGYEYVFPQASSGSLHGWLVIIKTRFRTYIGKERTSYGCGFDDHSAEVAERRAVINLGTYSWGWKNDLGYEVIEKHAY